MSLFCSRELWATQCGEGEESFDGSSLLVVDGICLRGGMLTSCIVVGSHSGVLRIFQPQSDLDAETAGFRATDLLIELQLSEPILQLGYGRLVSGSQSQHLAVLHSLKLVVYNISSVAGSAEHGDEWQLQQMYAHELRYRACALVVGAFGGGRGARDLACVQALDNTLTVYEQETFAFDRALPAACSGLPAPLAYLPQSDTFVVFNASYCLEAYRYGSLADDSGRKLTTAWSCNVGEEVLDIQVVAISTSETSILLLGERHLFCLRESGALKFVKRLSFSPLCFHSYLIEPDGKLMTLCVSDTRTLLVYEQTTLSWSSQLSETPVLIRRINFQSLRGLVLTLSETGNLQCSYLGTQPSLFVAPPTSKHQKSFEEAQLKFNHLQAQIAAFSANSRLLQQLDSSHELQVTANVMEGSLNALLNRCAVLVELQAASSLSNVQLTLTAQPPLLVSPKTHFISSLCEKYEVESTVSMDPISYQVPAFSLELQVTVAYLSSDLTPHVVHTSLQLPLSLAVQLSTPSTSSEAARNKYTISCSTAVGLDQLFREFAATADWNSCSCSDAVVGFQHAGVVDSLVTIAVAASKMAANCKYRVQTDQPAAATLLVAQLKARLETAAASNLNCGAKSGGNKMAASVPLLVFSHVNALPTQPLIDIIEQHVALRNNVNQLQSELGLETAQFRLIERRLLVKLRDKTPSPLHQLDSLLADATQRILGTSHQLEHAIKELEECGCRLSSVLRLHVVLMSLCEGVMSVELADLTAALSYTLHAAQTQGWEEVSEAGVCHLLRSCLARSIRDQQRSPVDPLRECARFTRHIALALERVLTASASGGPAAEQRGVSPILEGDEPPGSRAGRRLSLDEDSLSAKPRLLPLRKQNTVALEDTHIADTSQSLDLDDEVG